MNTIVAESVIIGKLSLPQIQGQLSQFALPSSFVWLQHFTAAELAEFFQELLEALSQSAQAQDWSTVTEVLEAWKDTANLKADPLVVNQVAQGLAELKAGQGESWVNLREELGL